MARDHYLGKHGTSESVIACQRHTNEWIAAGSSSVPDGETLSVTELCCQHRTQHANAYYRPLAQPGIKRALRFLKELYGSVDVDRFGPKSLKAIRQHFVEQDFSRKYTNKNLT
ncbi:MAG: hypothetical protein DWQ42_03340 [Planctomycetota bacterium]|nr:MAG: hypothetical protein DWQ42_03340 [Planctomycetota bacterium]REK47882.1 MAG: hypothetical protein DWQ46_03020 [Planctomycetota bacterium]